MVEADGATYGIPLHGIEQDHIHGASFEESELIRLLEQAYEHNIAVELDVRRSAFWGMDGSQDEIQAVIEGVRLG